MRDRPWMVLVHGAATWALALGVVLIDEAASSPPFSEEAYARHVEALEERLPRGFTVVVEKPFVVVGNEAPRTVRQRAARTVRWAVEKLREEYFSKDPHHIIDVWLLRDEQSYQRHAERLTGEKASTRFGFYSGRHRVLVMDISTGSGTLVHEIVHPFVESNFPGCPAWFNEGLGSLYECCREVDGRIRGLVNWRLPDLQAAVRRGALRSCEAMMQAGDRDFYTSGRGLNYAQARYLCYFLQERDLLREFYRGFVAAHRRDPTGVQTLRRVLGAEDLDAFQEKWEAFVLGLREE